jgi:hypothetical protein
MDSSFPDNPSAAVPRIVTTAAQEDRSSQAEKTYFNSDSSGNTTPEERSPGCVDRGPYIALVVMVERALTICVC